MTRPAQPGHPGQPALALYPLSFVEEGDQVIIGRPDIDSFAVFPADAAAVVQRLRGGSEPAAVAAWYEATYGETADIDDFIETLRDLGFIRPDDDVPAEIPAPPAVRWSRAGIVMLSAPALTLYALAAGFAVYLMIVIPALRPGPSKVFFSKSLLVILSVAAVVQFAGIAWHEGFHVLAGRRLGLASKLSVGRRLHFVVFQTTLTGLMGVPSRKRILPFCAGLIADVLFISVLTGLAEVSRQYGGPDWIVRVAVAMVYLTMLRMIWQAMIFMETDLYHVFASALRCPDLYRMTRSYLLDRLARLRGRPAAAGEPGWSARDLRIVRRYAPFVVTGSTAIIGLAAAATLPVLAGLAIRVYHGVITGRLASAWFWDALVTAMAILSQFAVVAAIAIRDKRRQARPDGA
jgi:hypothetical protein